MTKYLHSDQDFRKAVSESQSLRQVLMSLGIVAAGGNYATVKRRIKLLSLDTSHFTGKSHRRGKRYTCKRSLAEILTENPPIVIITSALRKRLIGEGVFEPECSSCKLNTWMNKLIPLELDHISGDRLDFRIENLRLLCPNCHAQTETYRGRNMKIRRKA